MNPEQPQNKKSDFTEAFDNDEMEINVSYEEIAPEEQLEIKRRVTKTQASNDDIVDSLADMWSEDNPEIVDVEEQLDSSPSKAESKNMETAETTDEVVTTVIESESDNLATEYDESETGETLEKVAIESSESKLDNLAIEYSESEIDEISEEVVTESSESKLDNLATEYNKLQISDNINELTGESPEVSSVSDDFTVEKETEFQETILEQEVLATDDSSIAEEISDNSEEKPSKSYTSETPTNIDLPDPVSPDFELTDSNIPSSTTKTELIADSWLDESENKFSSNQQNQDRQELTAEISQLEKQKANLQAEIKDLKLQKEAAINQQTQEIAENLRLMIAEGTRELKERKNNLLIDIEKLERRSERIRQEMRSNFAGASQDLAVRIQGFKEYLVGSLQELATAAERLDLPSESRRRPLQGEIRQSRESRESRQSRSSRDSRRPRNPSTEASTQPQFTEQAFAEQSRRIRQLLDKYRTQPDYYGAPWQLRRTFEPIHAERVQEWFFERGGRGTIKGMGSRLQNILVASAIISVLYRLYRDRVRVLVLVDTPEKLGEWRKGVQDCLGVSRNDFGSNRGIVLFESADVLVQRADRLLQDKLLPIIIIDETEELVNLALLKFPLWLAFAEKSQPKSSGYFY